VKDKEDEEKLDSDKRDVRKHHSPVMSLNMKGNHKPRNMESSGIRKDKEVGSLLVLSTSDLHQYKAINLCWF
jgi:hypothetical protein